jgi:hypothetical protein
MRGSRSARQHHDLIGIVTSCAPAARKARSSRAARARARPAARCAGSAVMTWLAVASQVSMSSSELVRANPNEAACAAVNGAPSGIVTVCCRDSRSMASSGVRGSTGERITSSSATQSSPRSRLVHSTPRRPPSVSTRAISGTVRLASNQCHACDTSTASAQPSGSGMSSARPSSTRTPGDRAASTRRIRSSGSMATTCPARPSSARVNRPVPAARSTATAQPAGSSQATAAGAGPGRTRS